MLFFLFLLCAQKEKDELLRTLSEKKPLRRLSNSEAFKPLRQLSENSFKFAVEKQN